MPKRNHTIKLHHHSNSIGVPPKDYKMPRDRSVPSRILVCPQCKAEIGMPCVSSTGNALRNPHVARRRIALRMEREAATDTTTEED